MMVPEHDETASIVEAMTDRELLETIARFALRFGAIMDAIEQSPMAAAMFPSMVGAGE